jgi:ribosome-associated protein
VPPDDLEVTPTLRIPLAEIRLRTSRSSGPGGQHTQKTETRVEAIFDVAASTALTDAERRRVESQLGPVVRAVAQDERSQARNRELALERLAASLAAALRPRRARRPTRPTPGSREERLAVKRRRGQTKRLRRPPGEE